MSSVQDFQVDARDSSARVVVSPRPTVIFEGTTAGTKETLTATLQASDIIDVREAREIALLVEVSYGETDSQVSLFPVGSSEATQPSLITDDQWFNLPASTAVSAAVPSGLTQLSNVDFTLSPEFGAASVYPLQVNLAAADATSDEMRIAVRLDVSWCKYFAVLLGDGSGATTLADVRVQVVQVA